MLSFVECETLCSMGIFKIWDMGCLAFFCDKVMFGMFPCGFHLSHFHGEFLVEFLGAQGYRTCPWRPEDFTFPGQLQSGGCSLSRRRCVESELSAGTWG